MRDLGGCRAECHHHLAVGSIGDVQQHSAELAPVDVWLDAGEHDEIALGPEMVGDVHDVLGPHDLAGHAVLEDHLRPELLEVEELVGLDVGESRRAGVLDEPVESARGGRRRVEVARERGDQHASTYLRNMLPDEILHPPHPGAARSLREFEREAVIPLGREHQQASFDASSSKSSAESSTSGSATTSRSVGRATNAVCSPQARAAARSALCAATINTSAGARSSIRHEARYASGSGL